MSWLNAVSFEHVLVYDMSLEAVSLCYTVALEAAVVVAAAVEAEAVEAA